MNEVINLSKEELDLGQIKVERLTKCFDSDAGNILALDGIDLDVIPQEFITLVGRSGCGKSTLLRCIGGLISPSTGDIKISGHVVMNLILKLDMYFSMQFCYLGELLKKMFYFRLKSKGSPQLKKKIRSKRFWK